MGLGASWILFWKGLGRSWALFGCSWALLGRLLGVLRHLLAISWVSWILPRRFWSLWEGFGRDFARVWERFWEVSLVDFKLILGGLRGILRAAGALFPRFVSKKLLCCGVLCCAELCCARLGCAVLCCAALRSATLYCAAARCAVLCCAVLCCATA